MQLTRRGFLTGSLGAATLLGLGACSNVHSGPSGTSASGPAKSTSSAGGAPASSAGGATASSAGPATSGGAKTSVGKVTGTINFAFWGGTAEVAGFQYAKQVFEKANPGATVNLKNTPYSGFFSGIDRGIQSGTAPDVFRVDFTDIGKYSSQGALLDLSPYLSAEEANAFLPALWDAIKHDGTPYGIPHEVDTTCIMYNKAAFQAAGITSVPDKLESAWSWDEFGDVADKLRKSLPANKYPFAYDWTQAGAFRWLSWLYQAGGSLLTNDLKKCALPSAQGTKAMDFTQSFFTKKWVPSTNTIKTSTYSDNFFLSQIVPMSFMGNFLVPELVDPKSGYKGGDWAATYMPQDAGTASDLGGNAIVAVKNTKNPDLAAEFVKVFGTEDVMKHYCEATDELPTLQSLSTEKLAYADRPDVVNICAEQATTISAKIVRESTVTAFSNINSILQDQLELAFHGQSGATTISAIASKVNAALSG